MHCGQSCISCCTYCLLLLGLWWVEQLLLSKAVTGNPQSWTCLNIRHEDSLYPWFCFSVQSYRDGLICVVPLQTPAETSYWLCQVLRLPFYTVQCPRGGSLLCWLQRVAEGGNLGPAPQPIRAAQPAPRHAHTHVHTHTHTPPHTPKKWSIKANPLSNQSQKNGPSSSSFSKPVDPLSWQYSVDEEGGM